MLILALPSGVQVEGGGDEHSGWPWQHLLVVVPVNGRDHVGELLVKLPIPQGIRRGLRSLRGAGVSTIACTRRRQAVGPFGGAVIDLLLAVVGGKVADLGRVRHECLESGPPLGGEQPVGGVVDLGIVVVHVVVQSHDDLGGGDTGRRRVTGGSAVAPA